MGNEFFTLKNIELKSRVVYPPMATAKSADDGKVSDAICEFYDERAKNPNIGLIITEHNYIDIQGKANPNQMSAAGDENIPGLKRLADTIHKYGMPVIVQINHAGSAARTECTGMPVVAPSAVPNPGRKDVAPQNLPEELTLEQIEIIKSDFISSVKRVIEAGFDGVEIHSAHGYLLNQFYSPITNKRTDMYGGSLENRIRLHLEIIGAVKEIVGDKILAIRLGGSDYMDGGSTIDDACEAAKAFEAAGVDLIDLSGGMCRYTLPGRSEPGYFSDMSEAVKKSVSVPVILTGGVKTKKQAEELAANVKADLIGVGRAIYADPDWEM